jgi:hypothetical protein
MPGPGTERFFRFYTSCGGTRAPHRGKPRYTTLSLENGASGQHDHLSPGNEPFSGGGFGRPLRAQVRGPRPFRCQVSPLVSAERASEGSGRGWILTTMDTRVSTPPGGSNHPLKEDEFGGLQFQDP